MAMTLESRKGKWLAGVCGLALLAVAAWQMELVDESSVALLLGEKPLDPAGAGGSPGSSASPGSSGSSASPGSPGSPASPGSPRPPASPRKPGSKATATIRCATGTTAEGSDGRCPPAEAPTADSEKAAQAGTTSGLPSLETEANTLPVPKALAALSAWRVAGQEPTAKDLRAFISHRKAWVALTAYAFAVERRALPDAELKALGTRLQGRVPAPLARRFLKRYKDKPKLRTALSANLGL